MELIWGITIEEIFLLIKQVGLATAGAAALWGFVFSIRKVQGGDSQTSIIDDWLSLKIFNIFLGSFVLAFVFHLISIPAIRALAHEGIAVLPTTGEIIATFSFVNILMIILSFLTILMLLVRRKSEEKFSYLITHFFAVAFILVFVMISLPGWRGVFDSIQIFHFIHGFHSIFTLGSVIVLDCLFLLSSRSEVLKQHVYSLFPTISKVIWVGLSLDFLSVFLITEYFVVTEKFLFVQTVIGILIINGVLLSGPIARRMIKSVMQKDYKIELNWRRAGSIAGALSITSWMTITSLDFLKNLTLGYFSLLALYLMFFGLALIGHFIFEKIESKRGVN